MPVVTVSYVTYMLATFVMGIITSYEQSLSSTDLISKMLLVFTVLNCYITYQSELFTLLDSWQSGNSNFDIKIALMGLIIYSSIKLPT